MQCSKEFSVEGACRLPDAQDAYKCAQLYAGSLEYLVCLGLVADHKEPRLPELHPVQIEKTLACSYINHG
jgi:hypothetical protein